MVAPHDSKLARSFLEAFEVASWGHVADALMTFGLFLDDGFGDVIASLRG